MKRPCPIAIVPLLLLCSAVAVRAAESPRVEGAGMAIALDGATGDIVAVDDVSTNRHLSRGRGGVRLFDGATEQCIALSPPANINRSPRRLAFDQAETGAALTAHTEYQGTQNRLLVRVTLANRGPKQRWVEVQVGLPIDFASGTFRYWQGNDAPIPVDAKTNRLAVNADPVVRHAPPNFQWRTPGHSPGVEAAYVFPFTCVYDNRTGIALGIDLDQVLTYHAGGVQPAAGQHRAFHYGTKLVLDPGQSLSAAFVAFRFTPEFGWRNAVERVYQLYPRHFELRPDVDPRIVGPGSGGWAAANGALTTERHRRRQQAWAWFYAPFQTTGLPFPNREDWNPTRLNGISYSRNMPYDQFIHQVADACTMMHDTVAVGFYVYNWRADYYAAKRYFPKALTSYFQKDRPPSPAKRRGGTVLGDGVEALVGVWALEPTLLKHTVESYRRIAEVYKPDGLAFDDCMGAAPCYFDHHAQGSPGRAFTKFFSYDHVFHDHKVHVYVCRGVAVHALAAEAHKLKNRDGKALFVAANTPSDYLACGAVDVAIEERVNGPHFIADTPFWGLGLRTMMGRKPICIFSGYRGEKYDRHDFDLFCLHIGATRAVPWEKEAQALIPLLRTLAAAGWRAVPAATAPDDILLSRFGTGLDTFIVAINRAKAPVATTLHIRNHYLGKGVYVFADHEGKPVANRLVGADTHVTLEVPASGYRVLRTVARVEADACQAAITAQQQGERLRLEAKAPVPHPITLRVPRAVRLKQVRRGAVAVAAKLNKGRIHLDGLTAAPTEATWWPRVLFLSSDDALKAFPFYDGDKPSAAVLYANQRLVPRPEVNDVAMRLAAFFAFHKAYTKTKSNKRHIMTHAARAPWIATKMLEWMEPTEAAIAVTPDAGIPFPKQVADLVALGHGVVAVGKGPAGRPVLFVTGPDRATVREAVAQLLDALKPHFKAFNWER